MRSAVRPFPDSGLRVKLLAYSLVAMVVGLTAVLGGCQEKVGVADIKGACAAFEAPVQPVLGKRRVDQRWIDRAVETGVTVCGWPRPKSEAVVARAVAGMQ